MRFLLRWQHVAPDTQLTGEAGLIAVLEQLQGFEAAAAAWEPELFSCRIRNYQSSCLDALCHAAEVAGLRLTPRASDDPTATSAAAPSKATPTAVVLRADLTWLLAVSRVGDETPPSVDGATAEVLGVLRARGASFATDLDAATRRRMVVRQVGAALGCEPVHDHRVRRGQESSDIPAQPVIILPGAQFRPAPGVSAFCFFCRGAYHQLQTTPAPRVTVVAIHGTMWIGVRKE